MPDLRQIDLLLVLFRGFVVVDYPALYLLVEGFDPLPVQRPDFVDFLVQLLDFFLGFLELLLGDLLFF